MNNELMSLCCPSKLFGCFCEFVGYNGGRNVHMSSSGVLPCLAAWWCGLGSTCAAMLCEAPEKVSTCACQLLRVVQKDDVLKRFASLCCCAALTSHLCAPSQQRIHLRMSKWRNPKHTPHVGRNATIPRTPKHVFMQTPFRRQQSGMMLTSVCRLFRHPWNCHRARKGLNENGWRGCITIIIRDSKA